MRSLSTILSGAAAALLSLSLLTGCSSGAPETTDDAASSAESTQSAPDCTVEKCVALTFDDGPGKFTNQLLDELAEAHAPATFFMVGKNVAKYPDTLKRMVAEGHELGSHTWDHADITKLTKEKIEHEVQWTDEAIEKASGQKPTVLRPPYGSHGAVYDGLIPYPLVLWDVDTLDWKDLNAQKAVDTAMKEVKPGSIILMHDIHQTSVDAVPSLVSKLTADGYKLVTVQQLFNGADFTAGKAYTVGPHPASAASSDQDSESQSPAS
ncbi:polysaccharide deacetylase family protein [Glutamicibacter sp.]|uniref:polysaccharide deacetylase family protein n=1 Tax=Glutamicibacter sp. TaxID=1931995 RepID=UPI0028BE9937|nr:polysaccharide deacetylase family protein [Glutamicibacter sp.]